MGKPLAERVQALSEHISAENDGFFGGCAPEDHLGNVEAYIERLEDRRVEPRWIPVAERLPDDGMTVLIALEDSDEPVWIGYHDADGWYAANADPVHVTHWKEMPEGPR